MSLFKKLFGSPKEEAKEEAKEPKSELDQLLSKIRNKNPEVIAQIRASYKSVKSLLDEEAERLAELGLPLPEQVSPFDIGPDDSLKLPRFNCLLSRNFWVAPQYHTDAQKTCTLEWPEKSGLKEELLDHTRRISTYCVPLENDAQNDEIWECFRQGGLFGVMERYPGRWFNRSPYGLHIAIGRHQPSVWEIPKIAQWSIASLESIEPLPADDIAAIHTRTVYFAQLVNTASRLEFPKPVFAFNPIPEAAATLVTDYIYGIRTPYLVLNKPVVYLKVLPNPEGRQSKSLAEDFTNKLLRARPISFDIVYDQGTIYFQFACAAEDQAYLEELLATNYPDYSIEPHTPAIVTQEFPSSLLASPQFHYDPVKTLADFAIDPYAQALTYLDRLPVEAQCLIRVTFEAVYESSVERVIQFLQHELTAAKSEDTPDKAHEDALSTRIKQLTAKLKPNQRLQAAQVCIYASSPEQLNQLLIKFVYEMNAPGTGWVTEEAQAPAIPTLNLANRNTTDDLWNPPSWRLVSDVELAALLHFPMPQVRCEHLETTRQRGTQPPPLYTEPVG